MEEANKLSARVLLVALCELTHWPPHHSIPSPVWVSPLNASYFPSCFHLQHLPFCWFIPATFKCVGFFFIIIIPYSSWATALLYSVLPSKPSFPNDQPDSHFLIPVHSSTHSHPAPVPAFFLKLLSPMSPGDSSLLQVIAHFLFLTSPDIWALYNPWDSSRVTEAATSWDISQLLYASNSML